MNPQNLVEDISKHIFPPPGQASQRRVQGLETCAASATDFFSDLESWLLKLSLPLSIFLSPLASLMAYKLSEGETAALRVVLLCLAQVGPGLSWVLWLYHGKSK